MTFRGTFNAGIHAPTTHEHDTSTRCKRSCCWTPMGHSTVRDSLPSWHSERCQCHAPRVEAA